MSELEQSTVEEIVVEKVRVAVTGSLTQSLLHHDVAVAVTWLGDELVVQLKTYVLAAEKERVVVYERWPEDWWQAFRERWFPGWWLEWYPVRYREINIDKPLFGPMCPHVAVSRFREHMQWLRDGESV